MFPDLEEDRGFKWGVIAVAITGILLSVAFWAVVLWALVQVVQSLD